LISDQFLMDNVGEFQSPNFHNPSSRYFEIFFLFSLNIFFLSRRKLNLIEILLIVLFTHLSLYSARYIALFALIIPPIINKAINTAIQSWNGKFREMIINRENIYSAIDSSIKGHLWPIFGVSAIIVAASLGIIDFKFDKNKKPVEAVEFIKMEELKGNIFNSDEFGDYIIFAAFPQYRVFIDGRLDMYGSKRAKEYDDVSRIKPNWTDIMERYDIKCIIFDTDSVFSRHLMMMDGWRIIYSDKVASIFLKNIPENKYLIEKYKEAGLRGEKIQEIGIGIQDKG